MVCAFDLMFVTIFKKFWLCGGFDVWERTPTRQMILTFQTPVKFPKQWLFDKTAS